MKKPLPLLLIATVFAGLPHARGQWCVPTTAIPYNANMPGLTRVTVGSIDRLSTDLENFPNNSYVNTGLSTTFEKGASYPIAIQFTIDASIAPHMNLRVWIDLNQDGQLDDTGETLLSVDHISGSYSSALTIPSTAMTGNTRMRVTAKMCSHGGHSLPTPCDMPPDILGYHGEIEDYDVVIAETSDIVENFGAITNAVVAPMPLDETSELSLTMNDAVIIDVEVMDASGRMLHSERLLLAPGGHRIPLSFMQELAQGTYMVRMNTRDGARTIPVVKTAR